MNFLTLLCGFNPFGLTTTQSAPQTTTPYRVKTTRDLFLEDNANALRNLGYTEDQIAEAMKDFS